MKITVDTTVPDAIVINGVSYSITTPPPPPPPPPTGTMMTTLYKISGVGPGGIYFNKADGTLGATTVCQLLIPGLVVGEKLMIKADTTVSLNPDPSIPYVGWTHNTFTASQLFMARASQSTFYDWSGFAVTPQNGQDIDPGSATDNMEPYYHHNQTGLHEIVAGEEGNWYAVFVAWASCSFATGNSIAKNEYLWVVPQQTMLSVLRFPS